MKIEKLKMTRMHNLFIIALSAMCRLEGEAV